MASEDSLISAVAVFHELIRFREKIPAHRNEPIFEFVEFCRDRMTSSYAQSFQDLLVLYFLKSKKNGYFVEFGATNGVHLSNTYLLEKEYRWKGILAEPARCWHKALASSRRGPIDTRCLWDQSGQILEFLEAKSAEFSTISEFRDRGIYGTVLSDADHYPVETVSLNDLLEAHAAPRVIDFMSVDTEGSEYRILRAFDFSKHDIRIMTVEHNYCDPDREDIRVLLAVNGFTRVFTELSKWDDWYVQNSVLHG